MSKNILIAIIIFSFCLITLLFRLGTYQYFHSDEANWARVSIFAFDRYFIERDWDDPGWSQSFRLFGKENPQVGKYLMGMSLWAYNYRTFDGVIPWNLKKGLEWHIQEGIAPSTDMLFAARLPIAILSAGTAALIYLLVVLTLDSRGANNWPAFAGVAAAVLFITHPTIWQASHRAMVDMPVAFFSTLTVYLYILSTRVLVENRLKSAIVYCLLGGIASGLAISIKMNALPLLPFAIMLSFMTAIVLPQFRKWILLLLFSVQLTLPWVIFILTNPYLYPAPLSGIATIFNYSRVITERAAQNPAIGILSLSAKWTNFVAETAGSLGNLAAALRTVDLLLIVVGLLFVTTLAWKSWNSHLSSFLTNVAILSWTLLFGFAVLVWTPLTWQRYYIPWLIPALLLEGIGLMWIVSRVAGWLPQKKVGLEDIQAVRPNKSQMP